jgi:hypothetical protein
MLLRVAEADAAASLGHSRKARLPIRIRALAEAAPGER